MKDLSSKLRRLFRTLSARVLGVQKTAAWDAELRLVRDSGFFDPDYYLQHNADVAKNGMDPLLHYVQYGCFERRCPGPAFDTDCYLAMNPDVAACGMPPLLHYLECGRQEGRRIKSALRPAAAKPVAPSPEAWAGLAPRSGRGVALVDVIVPVYKGFDDTLACLHSVLAAPVETPFELVVLNDRSPESELTERLRQLAAAGLFTLLENEVNLGFVKTANAGMRLHPDRHALLLNSDTVVYGNWLDRLLGVLESNPAAATVTPFSNNATICSYPVPGRNNNEEFEEAFGAVDAFAGALQNLEPVHLPTAVGFCMLIRRQALADVGLFDEEAFGQGYGEENDFCMRALARSWVHVLAPTVFVRHTGGVSFETQADDRKIVAYATLSGRHPGYHARVARHEALDPALRSRQRLDLARLLRGRPGVLFITHCWGGGIERHLRDLAGRLEAEGGAVLLLRPMRSSRGLIVDVNALEESNVPNICGVDLAQQPEFLLELLGHHGIRHVHIHSLAGYPEGAAKLLRLAMLAAERCHDFTVHDHAAWCPRIHMLDGDGRFCGGGPDLPCQRCVELNGSPFGIVDVDRWRREHGALLLGARRVYAPSLDAARRMEERFPGLRALVRPHEERPRPGEVGIPLPAPNHSRTLRIAVLGAVGPHKGSRVLLRCAEDALRRGLPMTFVVMGYTDLPELRSLPNLTVTGQYQEDRAVRMLVEQRCDLAFFPFQWPETFSYTLSLAALAGLYPVTLDLGAPAERIRRWSWGSVLPFGLGDHAQQLNDALLSQHPKPVTQAVLAEVLAVRYDSIAKDYYGLDLGTSRLLNTP